VRASSGASAAMDVLKAAVMQGSVPDAAKAEEIKAGLA
jgi:hypothetical protein